MRYLDSRFYNSLDPKSYIYATLIGYLESNLCCVEQNKTSHVDSKKDFSFNTRSKILQSNNKVLNFSRHSLNLATYSNDDYNFITHIISCSAVSHLKLKAFSI